MSWLIILNQIFNVCIVPLLGLATTVLIVFIKAKIKQSKQNMDNEIAIKYLTILEQTVVDCIKATNQTYVNALKDKNAFDADAQVAALKQTAYAVTQILSNDAKEHLGSLFGDLETLIVEKIEANIENAKK